MPIAFKPSRSKILSALILCVFFYLTYKYMFPKESENKMTMIDVPVDLKQPKEPIAMQMKPVTVTVFYECLCPDSRSFVLHHLVPAYEKAPHLVRIELVPYGKAKTYTEGGLYKFSCQHGPTECYGNKIHACAIEKIKDATLRLKMISCMIDDNMIPDERGVECSAVTGVQWKPIHECATGTDGSVLLKHHGDATNKLDPPVSFIPTILLNQSQGDQRAILKNLWKEICLQYPEKAQPSECLS